MIWGIICLTAEAQLKLGHTTEQWSQEHTQFSKILDSWNKKKNQGVSMVHYKFRLHQTEMLLWSLWPNSSVLVSSDHRTCLQNWRSLSLCAFLNCNLSFLYFFFSNVFFLAEWFFSPCQFRTGFSVDNDTLTSFSSIFTCCFAFVLRLIHVLHQSTIISETLNRLLPEQLDIPMVFLLRYNCLNRWMWHLQTSGNWT